MRSAAEILQGHRIVTESSAPGRYYTTCPKCSAHRKPDNQVKKVLGVTIDDKGACWQCSHCGWTGPEKGSGGNGRADDSITTYDYCDAGGTVQFQKVRGSTKAGKKSFWMRRPDGHGGWINGTKGVDTTLLYRLPEVIEALSLDRTIIVCEGEKDCDRLWSLGLPATCNAHGASEPDKKPKWNSAHSEQLRDADIVIIPDHDPQGHAHAEAAASLSRGVAKRVRLLDLAKHWPAIPSGGDVSDWLAAGHSREELDGLIALAPDDTVATELGDKPRPFEPNGGEAAREYQDDQAKPDADLGEWDAGDDTETPPPRGWLLGNNFCRRFLSMLLAEGGGAKSAVRYTQALSLATKRLLTGEYIFQRCRVLIISLEDDRDELRRRILAVMLHHKIDRSETKGWLFLAAPRRAAGKLMTTDNAGQAKVGELAAKIEAVIVKRKIDLVMIDPFIKSHSLEENANSLIDEVAQLLTDLGAKHDIAVDVPHHVSKGPADPGNANRSRGASAAVNAARLVYTLSPMSQEEANAFGIKEEDRRLYVRMDSAKVNITRHMGAAKWFRLVGVPLGNATDLYPNGDEVQTVEPWSPPDLWDYLTTTTINQILTGIDAGLPDGSRYTDAPRAEERAAWKAVTKHAPAKSEGQAREIIRTWVKTGLLLSEEYDNPATRKPATGLRVDPAKRPT